MASEISAFKCTPRQVREYVIDCIQGGLVPYIISSPGMGKSAICKSIAEEYQLYMIDHRLSTSAPEDMSGLPTFIDVIIEGEVVGKRATYAPFDTFPIESTVIPHGYQGWMLFLDEFNSAPKSVQAASYKLMLNKEVGLHKLHKNVVLVAAGNLITDRAIVNPLSTAMQSRVIHLEMEINFQQWLEDVAFKENYDNRIISYLSYMPSKLMDFRPDHNDKTFCCPRTWEFMNKLIKNKEVSEKKSPLYAGTITSGVATEFITFVKVYDSLPKIKDVINDPRNLYIPNDSATRYAITTYLIEQSNDTTFEDITYYINRFPSDFRVLFFRGLMIRHPQLRAHPAFRSAMLELSRYLHDD